MSAFEAKIFSEFPFPSELPRRNEVIDDVEMKKGCKEIVRNFYGNELDKKYADEGLIGRYQLVNQFYDSVKECMGIDAEIIFVEKSPYDLGGYSPKRNIIELNRKYLEKADCGELLNTILHESRHAFQKKCIDNPDSVTVKNNVIEVWKDNSNNYIRPCYDFEAYENQEVEKDANYFADSIMKEYENLNYA